MYNGTRSQIHFMSSSQQQPDLKIDLHRPGMLSYHGMRAALLDVEAGFWNLRTHLEALIGKRLTDTTMQHVGVSAGAALAEALQPAGSPQEVLRDCLAGFQATGFGCFEIEAMDASAGRAQVRGVDTVDAWLAARHADQGGGDACYYTAGFLVGAMQAAAGRKDLACVETSCQGRGDEACRFSLMPVEAANGVFTASGQPDPTMNSQLNLLQILFERAPLGIVFFDREYRLMRCNPVWVQFIDQYTVSSASQVKPGASFYDIVPGTEATTKPLFDRVLAGETLRVDGFPIVSGGVTSYWDTILTPLQDGDEVMGIVNVTIDATQREEALLELEHTIEALRRRNGVLRKLDERFKLVMSATNDGIWDWTLETGEVYYSPRWKSMLGYADEEVEGSFDAWRSLVHPEDRDGAVAAIEAYLAGDAPVFEHTHRLRHKDGSYRLILTRGRAARDEQGRPVRVAGSHSDVTERDQAERALKESEANHRALLETAHTFAVYRLALDPTAPDGGRVLMVSPSITEIAGIEDPYDFGTWIPNIHPEDQERVRAANKRSMEEHVPFDEVARFYVARKQKWNYVHTVSHPTVGEDGKVTHFNG
jgi:PAS domain S-box-containing protein